jgi:glutamate-1-semialdehyde 2,1-aminomutase
MDYSNGSGQKLWLAAKKIIPGGNQLLSKRAEMFLPNIWPAYYSKAKGYKVWDLDGREYNDFATMGIGACALGYADADINAKVKEAIDTGSMSTLNCAEEVELAKELISLHPWADMARFARSGGEVCSIAVRTARAATKKDKVLFCGYHGWHDWYLSSNIVNSENLDQQLLSGLSSDGVPSSLAGTAIPFNYNDLSQLKELVEVHRGQIAAVFMEPVRSTEPDPGFLEAVRDITFQEGIVLIFDEITSGFRVNEGGVHLKYNVKPDLAVFGKALGNGFPISAVIGVGEVMSAIQDTFVSSTFWTERVGFTAALATLEKFKKFQVHRHLIDNGKAINYAWESAAKAAQIKIKVSGLEPLTHIDFIHEKASVLQTLYTQEMLKKGYLVGSSAYATYAYNNEILEQFKCDTEVVFGFLKTAIDSGHPEKFMLSDIKHSGFQRLS